MFKILARTKYTLKMSPKLSMFCLIWYTVKKTQNLEVIVWTLGIIARRDEKV